MRVQHGCKNDSDNQRRYGEGKEINPPQKLPAAEIVIQKQRKNQPGQAFHQRRTHAEKQCVADSRYIIALEGKYLFEIIIEFLYNTPYNM